MTDYFKCQRCGSDTRMQLQIAISAPSSFYGNLSKNNLRKKECRIVGVKWETADYICTNHECRHVTQGYGNYVTNLQKENKQLKTMLEQFQDMTQVLFNTLIDYCDDLDVSGYTLDAIKESLSKGQ